VLWKQYFLSSPGYEVFAATTKHVKASAEIVRSVSVQKKISSKYLKNKHCRKYEHLMTMNGMDSSKLKSGNDQLAMPFESPLLKKLAFSKLTDATKAKFSITRSIRLDLADRALKCSKS
jgi:hypothetical protein